MCLCSGVLLRKMAERMTIGSVTFYNKLNMTRLVTREAFSKCRVSLAPYAKVFMEKFKFERKERKVANVRWWERRNESHRQGYARLRERGDQARPWRALTVRISYFHRGDIY